VLDTFSDLNKMQNHNRYGKDVMAAKRRGVTAISSVFQKRYPANERSKKKYYCNKNNSIEGRCMST